MTSTLADRGSPASPTGALDSLLSGQTEKSRDGDRNPAIDPIEDIQQDGGITLNCTPMVAKAGSIERENRALTAASGRGKGTK